MKHVKSALIIATSAAEWAHQDPTGLWLSELTTPYYALKDAGLEVGIASVRGGAIPIDQRSLGDDGAEASVARYENDRDLQEALKNSLAFADVNVDSYDAIFFPGGHGAMIDFPENPLLSGLIATWTLDGKILAAVCHGPAALVSARNQLDQSVISGRVVAGFSDSEEAKTGLDEFVPFALESRLRALGADYRSGPDFKPFAIQDGNLITGQNPQSSELVAQLLVAQLRKRAKPRKLIVLEGENDHAAA